MTQRPPITCANLAVQGECNAPCVSFIPSWVPVAALLVAGLTFAAPALATEHEAVEYGHVLTECYVSGADTEAKAACLGEMSTFCMETQDGGESTLGMTSCLNAEADVWDGFLNDEYRRTRDWARRADEDEAVLFPEYAVRSDKLLEAQRAWIAFRDAECALDYAEWGSGSMRNIAYADCRMTMTADRTIDLRQMREIFE